jgi:hypothetical protein
MAVLLKGAMFEAHIATSGTARRSRNQIVLIVDRSGTEAFEKGLRDLVP